MNIGIVGDVHGNHLALRSVVEGLDGQVDEIWFLGDVSGYYPFVSQCLQLLRDTKALCVRGNHDQVLLDCLSRVEDPSTEYTRRYGPALARALAELSVEETDWIASWPTAREFLVEDISTYLVHGAPWDHLNGRVYPDFSDWGRFGMVDSQTVIMGHTHYPLVHKSEHGLIINPGSVGQARDRSGSASYAILDVSARTVFLHRQEYDVSELIEDAQRFAPDIPYLTSVLCR